MSIPFTCQFVTTDQTILTNDEIIDIAKDNGLDCTTALRKDVDRFDDLDLDRLSRLTTGKDTVLNINFTDGQGDGNERLSKLLDNTQGSLSLIGSKETINVGMIVFSGQVPPSVWTQVYKLNLPYYMSR